MARRGFVVFVALLQSVLCLAHLFLYDTWTFSPSGGDVSGAPWIKFALAALSVSFVSASLLAFRFSSAPVRAFYTLAAVWAGLLNFLLLGAASAWIVFGAARLAGVAFDFHHAVEWLLGTAAAAGICGVVNAGWTRVTRITVRLANLPAAWRARRAALVSDLHLGHVRNGRFLRRVAARIANEKPDAIFIAGDFYDGTAIDARRAARPLAALRAPLGVYFVAGNHEQFRDESIFLDAIAAAGVRVLRDELVDVDGMQLAGVAFRSAARVERFASILRDLKLDPARASILLTHAPAHPQVAEAAGISLQLCGHTHLGQFIPWTWMVRRIYGRFSYGLSQIGGMQSFTSSGAGTWGPPLRLGSRSEVVLLEFQ